MNMKTKAITMTLICLIFTGLFSGCASKSEQESNGQQSSTSQPVALAEKAEEKVLTFGSVGYFYNEQWDPAYGWDGWAIGSYGVGEGLFRLDDAFKAVPWLVESYQTADNKTWEFILRDDVVFHNGVKMTAEAVKRCFERTLEVNERAKELLPIQGFEASGQSLKIVLSEAATGLANDLTDPLWTVYDAEGSTDFAEQTYYTGPYIPNEFNPGVELVVVKNEHYWGEAPKLDKAIFKTVKDADALTMAFQNGEIDVVVQVPETAIPVIQNAEHLKIDTSTGMRTQLIRFNMQSPAVQDAAVRKAISYSIDRDSYTKVISNNTTVPSYGIYPEAFTFGGIKNVTASVTAFDPEKAKQLLADAGFADTNGDGILEKNGVKLSLKMIGISAQKEMLELSQVLQSQLQEIGIDLKVESMENISEARKNGEFDLTYESYVAGSTGNPQAFIEYMFVTDGSNNFGKYSNPEVDALAASLHKASSEEEKNEAITGITQHILDDAPFIFFAHKNFTCVYNSETVAYFHAQPSEFYILDSSTEAK
ncbi:ABC transporter substrate-binding protein [Paenibacillus brevis]|uniref:ABC transporter substrate-binding protein n=1 Tax=Paenibacillus brevis TaxID=2841508 RepID=A0ABS6FM40_9BACL|nr:ABC transporter substrate-binding protein [Paenibacillus brevis]MBU5671270.1 ABC transporter substrate-binding protein [Paenibacillus brevis]